MLRKIANDLWDAHHDLKLMRIFPLGHRMAVVRLASGDLVVHSPIPYEDALAKELAELGELQHVIAPSIFHNLFLSPWAENYPDATFWAVPSFREQYPELRVDRILDDGAEIDGLRCIEVAGMPKVREHVLVHEASRSLLIADLVFHFPRTDSFALRMLLKMVGAYGDVAVSRLYRSCIKDRKAMRASVDRILEEDFDRIVVGHGDVVETQGKERLRRAYEWLSPPRGSFA